MIRTNRREFVTGATAIGGLMSGIPGRAMAFQAPLTTIVSGAAEFVPAGYLERTTEPADWSVEMDYGTELMPTQQFDEYCRIQVYPWAVNCESALSHVLVSNDLDASPNSVLMQLLMYKTEMIAESDFDRISRDGLNIFSTMTLTKTEAHVESAPEDHIRRHQLTAMNGWSKALHIERRGSTIGVVRTGTSGTPPWDFVDGWVDSIFASPDFETGMSMNGVVWELSYGPDDFHPSIYEDPFCN